MRPSHIAVILMAVSVPLLGAIRCNKGEYGYFSSVDCPNQRFCVHVDDNGYTYADCGSSTNPGIRTIVKLVDKGVRQGECTVGWTMWHMDV
ncbi:hypothetical protein QR680_010825 [Steinernema hermaphroditum]|uniref:Uncharacterized protein n=1 Tax=Steinernema hermaphroditum TaxID=289476 RepID=A0AA39IQ87_9BILA|nr:hypothetical protein QR680_010825 [Steinernema hermaphroditum]